MKVFRSSSVLPRVGTRYGVALLLALLPCAGTCRAQSTAQEWQLRAVQKYPGLGVRGSALNQRFVEAVAERRRTNPGFFAAPRWPLALADELAGTVQPAPPPAASPAAVDSPPPAARAPSAVPAQAATVAPAAQTSEYDAGTIPKLVGLEAARFRWWAPASGAVRGVLVLVPGRGGDGRGLVEDAGWQALATQTRFALMGCFLQNPQNEPYTYQGDPKGAVSDLINKAVNALLAQTGQPLRDPPLAFWGHSAGGNVTQQYMTRHADRVAGAVLLRATGGPGGLAPGKEDVPTLVCVGKTDKPEWVAEALTCYERGHRLQAEWTLALHAHEGHEIGKTPALACAHLAAAIALRLPPPPSGAFSSSGDRQTAPKPQRLGRQGGWLGDPATYEVAAYGDFKGKKQEAVWLLNEATARAWQQYLREP